MARCVQQVAASRGLVRVPKLSHAVGPETEPCGGSFFVLKLNKLVKEQREPSLVHSPSRPMEKALCSIFHPQCAHISVFDPPQDGNCFFQACARALDTSARDIRLVVARRLLSDQDKEAKQVRNRWRDLLSQALKSGDVELAREYQHAKALLWDPYLKTERYSRLFWSDLMSNRYWGEQFAVQCVEDAYGVSVAVLDLDLGQFLHRGDTPSQECITLALIQRHYVLLGWDHRFIISGNEFRAASSPDNNGTGSHITSPAQ